MLRRTSEIMLAVLLIAILVVAACALDEGQAAPNFELKDQNGKVWKLADLKDKVVVIVAATKDSGRAMGPWVDNLKKKYGNKVQVLGLLDLHDVMRLGRGIAKSRIRSETKDPLMLDFHGDTGKAYGTNDQNPVVVVIDKKGIVRNVEKKAYTSGSYNSLASSVDKVLKGE